MTNNSKILYNIVYCRTNAYCFDLPCVALFCVKICKIIRIASHQNISKSGGRPLSHSLVFLVYGCPNCHGCISWLWGGIWNIVLDTGFSTAMRGQSAFKNRIKNSLPSNPFLYLSSLSTPFCGYSLHAPALLKYVHVGNAMIISHDIFNNSSAFTCICHYGCPPEQSCTSQL